MVKFRIDAQCLEFPRDALLLDSNVCIAAFDKRDQYYPQGKVLIEKYFALVPMAVVVESCNLLEGRHKRRDAASGFMDWCLGGSSVSVIPDWDALLDDAEGLRSALEVDIVDAIVMTTASAISIACDLTPAIGVATYDTGDFSKLIGYRSKSKLGLRILDMRSTEFLP